MKTDLDQDDRIKKNALLGTIDNYGCISTLLIVLILIALFWSFIEFYTAYIM